MRPSFTKLFEKAFVNVISRTPESRSILKTVLVCRSTVAVKILTGSSGIDWNLLDNTFTGLQPTGGLLTD